MRFCAASWQPKRGWLLPRSVVVILIHAAPDPKTAKALGRKVRNFDKETWDNNRVEIVLQGNLAKLEQNEELHAFLKTTEGKILVEASPRDRITAFGR